MTTPLEQLKSLIASNPQIMTGAAGSGDIKEASAALAAVARQNGINIDAPEIEKAFESRGSAAQDIEPLDDADLDSVSGGGSPWCMWTKGCYCFFTK